MPKAAPGSRVLRGSAEGAGGGGSEEEQTEGGAALEAVTELDGKFEGWHLQAKQDAADAKAESAAGHGCAVSSLELTGTTGSSSQQTPLHAAAHRERWLQLRRAFPNESVMSE